MAQLPSLVLPRSVPHPQEVSAANALLALLSKSLNDLRRALRGQELMSASLEAMALALVNNQVSLPDAFQTDARAMSYLWISWQPRSPVGLRPGAGRQADVAQRMRYTLHDASLPCAARTLHHPLPCCA